MGLTTLAPTRALQPPRHVDARAIFGFFLTLFAMIGALAFWTTTSDTRAVLVVTRDLPAGATLNARDLAVARVRVDDAIYQAAVPATLQGTVVGRSLSAPLYANQILPRAQLTAGVRLQAGQRALTIPVRPDTAVGDALAPGDAVEVLLTTDKGKPTETTTVVLPRVTIYAVGHASPIGAVNLNPTNGGVAQGPVEWLTLVVAGPDEAAALAHARWAGELDVALVPPAPQSTAGNPGTRHGP